MMLALPVLPAAKAESTGSWSSNADYPFVSEGTGCAASGDIVFCVGGYDFATTHDSENVYYGTMTDSGITSWTATLQYGYGNIYLPTCVASGGYDYCIGGNDSDVAYYAEFSASGVDGSWHATGSYPIAVEGAACVVSDGYLTCVGGTYGGPDGIFSRVYYTDLENPGIGSWTETTDYGCTSSCESDGSTGIPIVSTACAVTGTTTTYITCVGGEEYGGQQVAISYYATLTDGAVGAWTQTTSYPSSIVSGQGSCFSYSGYMYCVAGYDEANNDNDYVRYSQLTDGALGSWTTASNDYPTDVYTQQCELYTNYVYCIAGNTDVTPTVGPAYSYYTSISSLASTTTTVTCLPDSIDVDASSTCTATVTGSSPTGEVSFTQTGSGTVTFGGGGECTLSSGSCEVSATGDTAGSVTVTGTYSGDSNNQGSFGTDGITVTTLPSTTTVVTCTPNPITVGEAASTCTAAVTGASPTGTVSFSQSGSGSVTFGSGGTCTLSSGSCDVSASGDTAGSVTVQGTYSGDMNNAGSFGTFALTVDAGTGPPTPPPPPPLPPVFPATVVVEFGSSPGTTLTGSLVGQFGDALMYNFPGLLSTDTLPYSVSFCSITSESLIRITGFGSVGPGSNSTELLVSNYFDIYSSSGGWPAEPACTT